MRADAQAPELELQQQLQRFTSQFTERVGQATETLQLSADTRVRNEALKKDLLYVASAMEIATGPDPRVSLLDMVVLIRLSRRALEQHWIPLVYGDEGAALADVFARSEDELRAILKHTLNEADRAALDSIIESWIADNPAQFRVEAIRLADFSSVAGAAAAERSRRVSGLLSSVKTATQTANQALLLAERGFFLLNRLPFLWRLQARIGAREVVEDTIVRLGRGPGAPLAELGLRARALARRGVTAAFALTASLFVLRLARR